MTNTWFTSDIHFGHKNIIKYCNRPFSSVEEMDRMLIDNWNSVVQPYDHVYQLGDFCFGKIDHIIKISNRLHGVKHYIYGNHDKEIENNEKLLLEQVHNLASIDYYRKIKVEGQSIILCHFAFSVWDKSHHGSWNLYGHSHSTHEPYKLGKQMDVGVDNAAKLIGAYRPFSLTKLRNLWMLQLLVIGIIMGTHNVFVRHSGFYKLKEFAKKRNILTIDEYISRFKQRLISKYNKTLEIADQWVEEIGEVSMFMFMLRFPDNPEAAADDDIQYGE